MPARTPLRRGRLLRACSASALIAVLVAATVASAPAASTAVVVTADIPSATNLTTTSCATGVADRTNLGTVLPGTDAVAGTGCAVTFGSSNDTSRLLLYQQDRTGAAMWRAPRNALDAGYGSGGTWTTNLAAGQRDTYRRVLRNADGSYFLIGDTWGTNQDAFIEKRTSAWALDTTFNGTGRRSFTNFGSEEAIDVKVDGQGRVVLLTHDSVGVVTAAVIRLTATGAMDTSFAGTGVVTTTLAQGGDGVVVMPDDRIALVGTYTNADMDARIAMFTTSGALDTGWGTGGLFTWDSGTGHDGINGAVVLPDGRITAVVRVAPNGGDIRLLRTNVGGTALDPTFGSGGVTPLLHNGCCAWIPDQVIQDDAGRLIVSGHVNSGVVDYSYLIRTSSTGALDPTFGTGGIALTDGTGTDDNGPARVIALPDGSYVLTSFPTIGTRRFATWRILPSGSIDTTYGSIGSGRWNVPIGGADGRAWDVALDGDGRVLVVGDTWTGSEYNVAAARLDSVRVTQFDDTGSKNWSTSGESVFGACLVSLGSSAVSAPWIVAGSAGCVSGSAANANWREIAPTSLASGAQVATTATQQTAATALFRFGLHTHAALPPGTYVAPVTLEVLAP